MKVGEKVIIMYPADPQWWKTEGFIVDSEGDFHMVQQSNGMKILIHEVYLKQLKG